MQPSLVIGEKQIPGASCKLFESVIEIEADVTSVHLTRKVRTVNCPYPGKDEFNVPAIATRDGPCF